LLLLFLYAPQNFLRSTVARALRFLFNRASIPRPPFFSIPSSHGISLFSRIERFYSPDLLFPPSEFSGPPHQSGDPPSPDVIFSLFFLETPWVTARPVLSFWFSPSLGHAPASSHFFLLRLFVAPVAFVVDVLCPVPYNTRCNIQAPPADRLSVARRAICRFLARRSPGPVNPLYSFLQFSFRTMFCSSFPPSYAV